MPVIYRATRAYAIVTDKDRVTYKNVAATAWYQDPALVTYKNVTATAWYQDFGLTLRNIQGYSFQTPLPSATVRGIVGYAFQRVQQALPVSKTAVLALYDLINSNRIVSTVFSASNTTLSAVSAVTGSDTVNSKVTLSALPSSGYGGSIDFTYRRAPLSLAITVSNALNFPVVGSATTIYGLLSQINTFFGLNLVQGDVVDGPLAAGQAIFTLTAAATSYMFLPGSNVAIGPVQDLTLAAANVNLPGFNDAAGNGPVMQTPTVLLMHFNGSDGQTTTVDELGHVATMSGGAKLTRTKSKFGNTSLQVIANGAQCTIPDAPELRFTGDMTIEFFSYINASGGDTIFLAKGSRSFIEYYTTYLQMALDGSTAGTNILSNGSGLIVGQWQHIAMVRKNGMFYFFVDGALIGSIASAGTFGNTSGVLSIGGNSGVSNVNAYIDELRISRVARYTAAFTPPAQQFAIDYVTTSLATNFSATPAFFAQIGSATTILNSLALINGVAAFPLLAEDLVDGPIAAGATSITLTANATSRSYKAGTQVTLQLRQTVLLAHFDGANNATTTTDDAGHAMTMGNGSVLTTAVKTFGSAAYQGPTTSSGYAQLPYAAEHQFAGDFTAECFFTPVAADVSGSGESVLFSSGPGSYVDYKANAWYVVIGSTNVAGNKIINGVAQVLVAGTTYHVAITRHGSLVSLWVNGQLIASASSNSTWGDGVTGTVLGNYIPSSLTLGVKGVLDEVRFIKGLAQYAAPFTPPVQAFAMTDAALIPIATAIPSPAGFLTVSSASTIQAQLAAINSAFKTNFLAGDLADGPIAANSTTLTLTAAAGSAQFVAGSTVSLTLNPKTALLLHFEGANGATTTTDDSNHTVTMVSNTITTAVKKFGNSSMQGLAAGTGYVTIPYAAEHQLPGNFTIETFFTPVAADVNTASNESMLFSSGTGSFIDLYKNGWVISLGSTNSAIVSQAASGAGLVAGTTYHIALTRTGTTVTLWVNGVSIATANSSAAWGDGATALNIGNYKPGSTTIGIKGSLDEVRITKGLARYIAAFTPPVAAFVVD